MTNPFERGSAGSNPSGAGTPGPGASGPSPYPPGPSTEPRPTLSTDGISERSGDNLESRLREVRRASDGMRAAKERIARLKGTGTAADNKVRATWTAGEGLDELHLDPKAMRLPSGELSAAIKRAITAAMSDLSRQTAQAMREETGISQRDHAGRVQEMREAFHEQMDEIGDRIDSARRAMERAMTR